MTNITRTPPFRAMLNRNAYQYGQTLFGPTIEAGERVKVIELCERPLFITWLGPNPIARVIAKGGRQAWVRQSDLSRPGPCKPRRRVRPTL